MMKKLLILLAFYLIQLPITSAVLAQQWAEAMFEERRHSFGSVAIGVEAVHRFKFKNPYPEDVHIASVTSSCGCTTPGWPKTPIKYGETGEITARLNTDGRFKGDKSATLTVVIDRPYRAEVQLQVTSYIRPDVVITPGVAEFGSVSEGKKTTKKLTMQYAGRPNWELTDIKCTNPHIHVKADEVERKNGRVVYDIAVTIWDTMPSGYVHDVVRFITNDTNPNSSVVMLPVHGYVAAPLVAKPSPFVIGFVKPGDTVKKNIVLRSDAPFRITKITSRDQRFQFALSDLEHNVHVLPITFTADSSFGPLDEPIIIHTTLAGQQQMQLLTQGVVFDENNLQVPYKQMLAKKSPEQTPPKESPAPSPEPEKQRHQVAESSEKAAKMQIQMAPQEQNRSKGLGEPPVVRDAETLAATPQPTPGKLSVSIEAADASTPVPQVAAKPQPSNAQPVTRPITRMPQPGQSLAAAQPAIAAEVRPGNTAALPTPPDSHATASPSVADTTKPSRVDELEEVPFESSVPEMPTVIAQNETNGQSVPVTVTPQVSTPQQADDPSVPIFEVIGDETQHVPAATSNVAPPNNAVAPGNLPMLAQNPAVKSAEETVAMRHDAPAIDGNAMLDLQPPSVPPSTDQPPAQGLSFSKPSIKDNLAIFSETKPKSVDISDVFDIVEPQNAGAKPIPPGNAIPGTSVLPLLDAAPRIARAVPAADTPRIPPVPGMKPTQVPMVPPLPITPAPPENRVQPELKPPVARELPRDLTPPTTSNTTIASEDGDLIASLFGGTTTPKTGGPVAVPLPPNHAVREGNQTVQGDLKPLEVQPLEPAKLKSLNGQRMSIPSASGGISGDDGVMGQDSILQQPDAMLLPLELNSRTNASNANRGRISPPDDLPISITTDSVNQRQGNVGPSVIANGAPIPTVSPTRASVQERMVPNNMQNQTANRNVRLPSESMQQRPETRLQPGNAPQMPQQMQQRAAYQQQQNAGQSGQAATTNQPQTARVAQANTNSRPQQQTVTPPAPVVQNTPIMTPAPDFR